MATDRNSHESDARTIAIVGAGISGLVAGQRLHETGLAVTLFEKSRAWGDGRRRDEPRPRSDSITERRRSGSTSVASRTKSASGKGRAASLDGNLAGFELRVPWFKSGILPFHATSVFQECRPSAVSWAKG